VGILPASHTVVKNLRRKLSDDADNPNLHLHRASRWLPDAEGGDAGARRRVSARSKMRVSVVAQLLDVY
jgi:hypothetical protein